MDLPDCTNYIPADPEYVFAVLSDIHRCHTNGRRELSLDTLIDDWELESDFGSWRAIACAMNWFWELDGSMDEWRDILLPMQTKKVQDVCTFISQRVKRPTVMPLHVLGQDCRPAGAFLAIRAILQRAELGIPHITPSTPLNGCRYPLMLSGQVSRIAPGVLPRPDVVHPLGLVGVVGMVIGLPAAALGIILIAMAVVEGSWLAAVGGSIALAVFPASMALYYTRPRSVTFGPLRTFGDLAKAIADQHP